MKRNVLLLMTVISIWVFTSCKNSPISEGNTKDILQNVQVDIPFPDTSKTSINIQYVISSTYPPMDDSIWKSLSKGDESDLEIPSININQSLWIRFADMSADSLKWNVYGPLGGDNQIVDVTKVINKG